MIVYRYLRDGVGCSTVSSGGTRLGTYEEMEVEVSNEGKI